MEQKKYLQMPIEEYYSWVGKKASKISGGNFKNNLQSATVVSVRELEMGSKSEFSIYITLSNGVCMPAAHLTLYKPVIVDDNGIKRPSNIPVPPKDDFDLAKRLLNLRDGAISRNIACTITFTALKKLYKQKTCFYTGVVFDNDSVDLHRTIDRVDSSEGYTNKNTVVCTKRINVLKSNLSFEEAEFIYLGMKRFREEKNTEQIKALINKTQRDRNKNL